MAVHVDVIIQIENGEQIVLTGERVNFESLEIIRPRHIQFTAEVLKHVRSIINVCNEYDKREQVK